MYILPKIELLEFLSKGMYKMYTQYNLKTKSQISANVIVFFYYFTMEYTLIILISIMLFIV